SKLRASTVTVDLKLDETGRLSDFGRTVNACLLRQAAASVMRREILGSTPGALRVVGRTMRRLLQADGPPPTGRWADLAMLEPVRDYKARHASTLLVFDAVERALDEIEARRSGSDRAVAAQ